MKWGVGGFVGGFLLCYFLLGFSQPQRAPVSKLAEAPTSLWHVVVRTNLVARELIEKLPLRQSPARLDYHFQYPEELIPSPLKIDFRYSQDLIDTRTPAPSSAE